MTPAATARRSIFAAQRQLDGLYRLGVVAKAWRFLLSGEEARAILPEAAPTEGACRS